MVTIEPLQLQVRDTAGTRGLRLAGTEVALGRDPTSTLRINDPLVSRRHGRIELRPDGWYYEDVGSRHGTFLNGQRLVTNQSVALRQGDTLQCGGATVEVLNGSANPNAIDLPEVDETVLIDSRQLGSMATGGVSPPTSMGDPHSPPSSPADHDWDLKVLRIGRAIDNDIVVTDPTVSSYHLEAWLADNGVAVRDLGSLNGTFIGAQRVTQAVVPPNAVLRIGSTATLPVSDILQRLNVGAEPSLYVRLKPQLEHLLVGKGLGRIVGKEHKPILRNVDAALRRGQMIAIAGASGSGKSTLMKVLNGYTPPDTGSVMAVQNESGEVELGYVPQDDIIHRDLPLRDAITLSARLRYPPGTDSSVIEQRADEVLTELGLKEHAKTLVSRLSGGQRKRASVALELMTKPRLLLLDEPTSGLDPASDRRLMRLLRSLADSGYGILLVTHTTTNIAQCDTVAFLAPGGYLVFWGSPEEAKKHFDTDNLEEVYEKLDSDVSPEEWRRRFEQSEYYRRLLDDVEIGTRSLGSKSPLVAQKTGSSRFAWQLSGLIMRYFRTLLADRRNLVLLLGQVPIILLLARLTSTADVLALDVDIENKSINLIFIISSTAVWLGTINACREICKESTIWERERHIGIRPFPYLLSKTLVLGALCVVQTAMMLLGLLGLWEVPGGFPVIGGISATVFMASLAGVSAGLAISAWVSTPDRAVSFVPLVMIPQILFGGGVVPLQDMGPPGKIISSVVAARWAFAALGKLTDRAGHLPVEIPKAKKFADGLDDPWLLSFAALIALCLVFTAIAAQLVSRGNRD